MGDIYSVCIFAFSGYESLLILSVLVYDVRYSHGGSAKLSMLIFCAVKAYLNIVVCKKTRHFYPED